MFKTAILCYVKSAAFNKHSQLLVIYSLNFKVLSPSGSPPLSQVGALPLHDADCSDRLGAVSGTAECAPQHIFMEKSLYTQKSAECLFLKFRVPVIQLRLQL